MSTPPPPEGTKTLRGPRRRRKGAEGWLAPAGARWRAEGPTHGRGVLIQVPLFWRTPPRPCTPALSRARGAQCTVHSGCIPRPAKGGSSRPAARPRSYQSETNTRKLGADKPPQYPPRPVRHDVTVRPRLSCSVAGQGIGAAVTHRGATSSGTIDRPAAWRGAAPPSPRVVAGAAILVQGQGRFRFDASSGQLRVAPCEFEGHS